MSDDGQLSFDDVAHARSTDPWTSHAAAASLEPETLRASQQAVLACLTYLDRRVEFDDLVISYRRLRTEFGWPLQSPSGIRTRTHELVEKGMVIDSGYVTTKASGRRAKLWEVA